MQAKPLTKIKRERRHTRWRTKQRRRKAKPLYKLPHGVAWHAIMVSWDSKERGITLGDSWASRGVYLGCSACNRWVGVEIAEAIRAFGAHTHMGDIARRLRCSECGESKGYVTVWAQPARR